MEISEGVIRLGLRPRRITPSSISIILHKTLSLIHLLLNKHTLTYNGTQGIHFSILDRFASSDLAAFLVVVVVSARIVK